MGVQSQEAYLNHSSQENIFFKRRFDSLNRINTDFKKYFTKIRSGKRNEIIELRNNFNIKHKLNVEFETVNYPESITDSVFNRLIEIDIYRLQEEFQNRLMFLSKKNM